MQPKDCWLENVDFNGVLAGNLLRLVCDESNAVIDVSGRELTLSAGLKLTVCDRDLDENGGLDRLFASGTVVPKPPHFEFGSRWYLLIDQDGIRHESDLRAG